MLFDRVLALLTTEVQTPSAVCGEMGLAWGALLAWCNESEERIRKLKDALEVRGHLLAEEAVGIADAADPETVGVARLQVDTRKWMASRLNPKWFGEKKELNVAVGVNVDEKLGESLNAILARVVEGEVVQPVAQLQSTPEDQEI